MFDYSFALHGIQDGESDISDLIGDEKNGGLAEEEISVFFQFFVHSFAWVGGEGVEIFQPTRRTHDFTETPVLLRLPRDGIERR